MQNWQNKGWERDEESSGSREREGQRYSTRGDRDDHDDRGRGLGSREMRTEEDRRWEDETYQGRGAGVGRGMGQDDTEWRGSRGGMRFQDEYEQDRTRRSSSYGGRDQGQSWTAGGGRREQQSFSQQSYQPHWGWESNQGSQYGGGTQGGTSGQYGTQGGTSGQYGGQSGQYGSGQYGSSGQYGGGQYGSQRGQYGQGGQYGQSGQYGQTGGFGQTGQYGGQSGQYGGGQYGSQSGQYGGGQYGSGQYGSGQYGTGQHGSQTESYGREGREPGRHEHQGFAQSMLQKVKDFIGKGPKGYTRSDERILEEVCERLSQGYLDSSEIEVTVKGGEVTLEGSVPSKHDRRLAEDIIEDTLGVKDIENKLKVKKQETMGTSSTSQTGMGSTATGSMMSDANRDGREAGKAGRPGETRRTSS